MVTIAKLPKGYRLECSQTFIEPIETVFEFFSDAFNLEKITPDILRFRVITEKPIELREGALIDYRLSLHGIPFGWRTEISEWKPPFKFVDQQLKGPYRWWIHTHTFEQTEKGTVVHDSVDYGVPFGALSHWLIVERDVRKIFDYRQQELAKIFTLVE